MAELASFISDDIIDQVPVAKEMIFRGVEIGCLFRE